MGGIARRQLRHSCLKVRGKGGGRDKLVSNCLCVRRTDNGGEFIFAEFEEYCAEYGVKQ